MGTLLHANLCRLVRDPAFRVAVLLTVGFSGFICYANYNPEIQASDWNLNLEDVYFTFLILSGFLFAGCVSLMQGVGYEYGTLRTLFIAGYTRVKIYMAALVTAWCAAIVLLLLHGAVTVPVGLLLFQECAIARDLVMSVPVILLTGVCYVSIFTAISMNCSSRGVSAVSCLGVSLVFAALPNPEGWYLLEPLFRALQDITPTGQLLQMYGLEFAELGKWAVLSVGLSAVVSVCGCVKFMKKEIN